MFNFTIIQLSKRISEVRTGGPGDQHGRCSLKLNVVVNREQVFLHKEPKIKVS